MKTFLALATATILNGCALLPSFDADVPQVRPVEVVTIEKPAPMYHPPLPSEIVSVPVEWKVLTPATMEEYLNDLQEGAAPSTAWYALTTKGYENLSTNMAEIKRYLRQALSVIEYYRQLEKDQKDEE
jgi:hypothetical protein